MTEGFSLELQDYCAYCGEFEPDVEKVEVSLICEKSCSYMTTIKCQNANKCSRIAENMKDKVRTNETS